MKNEFSEIIDFAIDKEKEAIDFYNELKIHEKMPHVIKVLDDIINMEKGHINKLKFFKNNLPNIRNIEKLESIKLIDYYEEPIHYENLDFIALLRIAIKREDQSRSLYQALADNTDEQSIKEVFILLANEEEEHKQLFEHIYQDKVLIDN
ncbi:MAG: ferritin family protein [Candidatus Cloacimonadales bacterium]|jgi:rubrerythrin|nr:ferritin family protein [Candidatus Cloacimonadales bacterium]